MKFESKTLGILGGGQLGRMSALAAARLGIRVHIYSPEPDSPASMVAARTFVSPYEDKAALKKFAETVDVITYEFENVPVGTVRYLQAFKPVLPDDRLLEVAQHRAREKKFLNDIGIPTAGWAAIADPGDIAPAAERLGGAHFILKTARFGYDGKGQADYRPGDDAGRKWQELGKQELVLEQRLDFACEISVIVARDKLGQTAYYGPVLNEHRNGILSKSTIPAPIPEEMASRACAMADLLAGAVDLVGVLALEMFVAPDGRILANEIAPRTHNSGHWTIDACACSQFEQHVRAVCSLPVGDPFRHSDAVMHNLIGNDAAKAPQWLDRPGACVHLYGKDDMREGRKMGHITILKDRSA